MRSATVGALQGGIAEGEGAAALVHLCGDVYPTLPDLTALARSCISPRRSEAPLS